MEYNGKQKDIHISLSYNNGSFIPGASYEVSEELSRAIKTPTTETVMYLGVVSIQIDRAEFDYESVFMRHDRGCVSTGKKLTQTLNVIIPDELKGFKNLFSQDAGTRAQAVEGLSDHSNDDVAIRHLWHSFEFDCSVINYNGRSVTIRNVAQDALVKIGTKAKSMGENLMKAEKIIYKRYARDLLIQMGSDYFLSQLVDELKSSDFMLQKNAITQLGDMKRKDLIYLLEPLLKDTNPSVQLEAKWAIDKIKA